MFFLPCADRVGSVDGRESRFEESIYLLNEEFTVIGLREATGSDAPGLSIGDCFFDCFKASQKERAALSRMQSSISCDSFLMRAGRRPVLFLCQFFARTHLLVAIVPKGEIRACLDAPAAFADVLEALHVQVSAEARVLGEPLDSYRYTVLCEWLSRVHIPLFFKGYQNIRSDADIATVATRLFHLALLCGCRLDYDLSGFGYESLHTENFDLLVGVAFAVFLMTHRVGQERSVTIYGKRLPGEGPVLHVQMHCDASLETLSELEVLCRDATARSDLFELYQNANSVFPLHLEFSFCNKELSAQDLKVKILFDRGDDVVRIYSLTDEEIADMQNEINASKQ